MIMAMATALLSLESGDAAAAHQGETPNTDTAQQQQQQQQQTPQSRHCFCQRYHQARWYSHSRYALLLFLLVSAVGAFQTVQRYQSFRTDCEFVQATDALAVGAGAGAVSTRIAHRPSSSLLPSCVLSGARKSTTILLSNTNTCNSDTSCNSEVTRLREEAAKMRLEAERMDWELTLSKLKALETKAAKLKQGSKTPDTLREAIDALDDQIKLLQQKLGEKKPSETSSKSDSSDNDTDTSTSTIGSGSTVVPSSTTSTTNPNDFVTPNSNSSSNSKRQAFTSTLRTAENPIVVGTETDRSSGVLSSTELPTAKANLSILAVPEMKQSTPNTSMTAASASLSGFDEADLALYIPVAVDIEATMPNATADERLDAFRNSPLLQDNFQQKISHVMKDMIRLDELKNLYLESNSSKEKESIKRQIDSLRSTLEKEGPFAYSSSVYRETLALTDDAIQVQIEAISALPHVLQNLYKKRHNLECNADLRLAILFDHYAEQMQLLEQVKILTMPLAPDARCDVIRALESLPMELRNHIATVLHLDPNGYTIDQLIVALSKDDTERDDDAWEVDMEWEHLWNPLQQQQVGLTPGVPMALDWRFQNEDIEKVDRSRYLNEFYPAFARMEGQQPSQETVDKIALTVLDKKTFMVTGKVERVVGGYYIRGRNLVDEDGSGVKLLERLNERLRETASIFLDEERNFECFYIPDPADITDEELELEYRNDPVLVVTTRNATRFYDITDPFTKAAVSGLALCSMVVFGLDGVGEWDPNLLVAAATENTGVHNGWSLLMNGVGPVVIPLLGIQLAHEMGHRWVAWRDKFEVGNPTIVPSIQLGCLGTITPIVSPPPNLKSLFDFGMAGPAVGMVASLALLVHGLSLTATSAASLNIVSMDLQQLPLFPTVPTSLLRSSALCGGIIEWFLGPGTLLLPIGSGLEYQSVLPLHAFAIAGFVGIVTNALALLPLGNTDGGRIAVAIFGRRGTSIVQRVTTLLLCGAGLLGYDDAGILLQYALLTVLFQTELETPARNEVQQLDAGRATLAILAAMVVWLALVPMH